MTSDPRRWLEEGVDPELAQLLDSAQADEPSSSELERLTSRVSFLFLVPPGGLPPTDGGRGGPGGGAAGGGAAAGAGKAAVGAKAAATGAAAAGKVAATATAGGVAGSAAAVTKTVLIVTVSTLAAAGGVVGAVALSKSTPTVPAIHQPAPQAPVELSPPPPLEVPDEAVPPEPEAPTTPRPPPRPPHKPATRPAEVGPSSDTPPPPPAPAPSVDAELDLLQQALDASQAGHSAEALAAVGRHIARFPSSPMAQEREVIAIEALVQLGRVEEARTRAQAFRVKWPTSTHLLRLETLVPP